MSESVVPLAGAISTYGLYAIIAILSIIVAYLYMRVSALEKEMRDQLKQDRKELTELLLQSNAVTERNTAALNEINSYFRQAALAGPRPTFVTIPPATGPNPGAV